MHAETIKLPAQSENCKNAIHTYKRSDCKTGFRKATKKFTAFILKTGRFFGLSSVSKKISSSNTLVTAFRLNFSYLS